MSATTTAVHDMPRINPASVAKLLRTWTAHQRASAAEKHARKAWDEQRAKCRAMFPDGVEREALEHLIKRTTSAGQRTFSLARYLEHHPLTPEMTEYVGQASDRETWTIKPVDGPPER